MINKDANSFLEHARQVHSLAEKLSEDGIAIYEHSYDMLSFGSWLLILGKRKYRVRFIWDGKDGILITAKALIPDSGTIIKWEEMPNEIETDQTGGDIFKSIEAFIKKNFEAQQQNRGDRE
ncbi:MAG: hypothetical protein AABY50_08890 [Nitrospirota bacterium]